nr:hypothetical protein [Tanacetum cinerariifolium]
DALDSAAGGNFLDKIPRECLSIIESKSKVIQEAESLMLEQMQMLLFLLLLTQTLLIFSR